MKTFLVADLNSRGELQRSEDYSYDHLAQIPGASDLITSHATALWRDPEGYDLAVGPQPAGMHFRWRPVAETAGIGTLRCDEALACLCLVVSGVDPEADRITLQAFQQRLLSGLRDTGYEPAFALMEIERRPMVATIEFQSPADSSAQYVTALNDRCFAAAYFRRLALA